MGIIKLSKDITKTLDRGKECLRQIQRTDIHIDI